MLAANIPYKFTLRWAQNAGGAFIQNPIPDTTATPGRASFDQGYPTTTFTPISAGGVPPDGSDENGIFYALSAWSQWQQAGGQVLWDSSFASGISGYPLGAIVASASVNGQFWLNGTDGNTTNPDAGGAGWTAFQIGVFPATGAQLQYSSATQLLLAPKQGGFLWINGYNYAVPANLTLINTGLSASTLYYIYAFISGGVMTLDKSVTGYTVNANGIPQKAGDATRTLVGMVFTNSSTPGQFLFADGTLQVLSYFQRDLQRSRTQFSSDHNFTSGTFVEINSEIRNSFLIWSGGTARFSTTGSFKCAANQAASTAMDFDGGSVEQEAVSVSNNSGASSAPCAINGVKTGLSEGLHYATLFGARDVGTAIWSGTASSSASKCSLTIAVMG